MAIVRVCLAALILLLGVAVAFAADPDAASALYDRPVLVVDPGMHTVRIRARFA